MEEIKLADDQREALVALLHAARKYPEAARFEHDRSAVFMPGARHDAPAAHRPARPCAGLGHLGAVEFTMERDGFGARWTFVLTTRAADFV